MATSALVSTVVTGAVLLVILAVVLRIRNWQHPTASAAGVSTAADRLNGPLGWSITFFVVAFGIMAIGMAYATGEAVAGLEPAALGLLFLVVVAVVFVLAGVVAVYGAVKSRGLNSAQAAGLSSVVLATLVLAVIVAQLLMGG